MIPSENRSENHMPLTRAANLGGDYLDLKELARGAGGKCAAVFRIKEHHAPERGQHGYLLPVTADVLICSGPRAGEVVPGERFIGAITSALRGVRNPNNQKGEQPSPPTTKVGDDVIALVKLHNEGKTNETAVGDSPSDADVDAAQMYYKDGAGFTAGQPAAGTATSGAPAGDDAMPWD